MTSAAGAGSRILTKLRPSSYICKRAGIAVHYCAEQFENDGSIGSSIIKTVKRAMAGEYSRELSVKGVRRPVAPDPAWLSAKAARPASVCAGSWSTRMARRRQNSARGEHKSITTDRVILVPWPRTSSRSSEKSIAYSSRREAGERDRRASECAGGAQPTSGGTGRGHGPSAADQREVCRQQCLGPNLLQVEAGAGSQPPGAVDSCGRRV